MVVFQLSFPYLLCLWYVAFDPLAAVEGFNLCQFMHECCMCMYVCVCVIVFVCVFVCIHTCVCVCLCDSCVIEDKAVLQAQSSSRELGVEHLWPHRLSESTVYNSSMLKQ